VLVVLMMLVLNLLLMVFGEFVVMPVVGLCWLWWVLVDLLPLVRHRCQECRIYPRASRP
jgi:hypothetical protein